MAAHDDDGVAPRSGSQGAPYPMHWEADVVLRDGGTARVRPIRPDDAEALQAFHVRQSERSTYLRFFAPLERLPERDLVRFTQVDHHDRVALVAVTEEDGRDRIIAVARFDRTGPTEAEVAFNVADDHHGRGLGSVLLEHLAAAARERAIERFTAEVLPQNGAMLAIFREAGYVVRQHLEDGIVSVSFDIDPTERLLAVMAGREQRAEARSVEGMLTPRSVLVVAAVGQGEHGGQGEQGGDPEQGEWGEHGDHREHRGHGDHGEQGQHGERRAHGETDGRVAAGPDAEAEAVDIALARAVLANLAGAGTSAAGGGATAEGAVPEHVLPEDVVPGDAVPGIVRPVVHAAGPVGPVPGVQVWADVADVPGPVDLLVLAVPAAQAAAAVRRCAHLRAHAVVVLSSGFAETGPQGLAHQRDLLRAAHGAGMRVLGPASYGFFRHGSEAAPTVNASLASVVPQPGRIALFCQSAPMAVGLLASARRRGLGLSTFVSSGNRADVSGNDLMQFWSGDEQTDVVGLYLESIGNPRKFARVARRLAATTPLVVLTAGRSGHVIPAGHAVRLTRVPRRALEEMLRQCGAIRVESQHQLLDVTQLLAHQPLPTGRRVTVLAGSEPLAAIVAEASASAGLTVGDQQTLVTATATPEGRAALEAQLAQVYADPACDAVVVVHVPTLAEPDENVARVLAAAAARSGRTTVACILGLSGAAEELTAPDADGRARTVPAYATPEDGVLALAAAVRYSAWRAADHGQLLAPDGIDRHRARTIVDAALAAGRDTGAPVALAPDQAAALLGCYGVDVWRTLQVHDAEEAVRAAEELGWPVALKSTAAHLRHRIDLGGVRLDLTGPAAVVEAYQQMRAQLAGRGVDDGAFEVQRMAPAGAACVIRSSEDPRFGPVVSFGLAGDAVDLLGDVSHGVAPLTDVDVAEMVRSVRASPRLFGYRGLAPLDVAAVEDVLGRVSVLADDLPEVHGLELHPVVVGETGAAVLAARVELAEAGRADGVRRALPQ